MHFIITRLLVVWLALSLSVFGLRNSTVRQWVGWSLPFIGILMMWVSAPELVAWQKLFTASLVLLYLLKGTVLLQRDHAELSDYSKNGLLLYLTLWPGMDPSPFKKPYPVNLNLDHLGIPAEVARSSEAIGPLFVKSYVFFWMGLITCILTAVFQPEICPEAVGWLGILGLLLTIHFGYSGLLTVLLRFLGWPVGPLFQEPFQSRSLYDFWSRRWNMPFVEMNRLLFIPRLKRLDKKFGGKVFWSVLGIFLISGLLHDLAISYPANMDWGLPTLYFLLQGVLVLLEISRLKVEKRWPGFWARCWTWFWLIAPLPLLFHEGFRTTLILPLFEYLHHFLTAPGLTWWFSLALWLSAAGHFCTLGAGLQVPIRLNWKEEMARLSTFTRKIFTVYYVYTGMTIITFGILSVALHQELLQGDRLALILAFCIGAFWALRVIIDFTYFQHDDWPKGPLFVIGHTILTHLFLCMSGVNLGLIAWHYYNSSATP